MKEQRRLALLAAALAAGGIFVDDIEHLAGIPKPNPKKDKPWKQAEEARRLQRTYRRR